MKSVIIPLCCIVCGFIGFLLDECIFNGNILLLTWVLFFFPAMVGIGMILDKIDAEKEKSEQERGSI